MKRSLALLLTALLLTFSLAACGRGQQPNGDNAGNNAGTNSDMDAIGNGTGDNGTGGNAVNGDNGTSGTGSGDTGTAGGAVAGDNGTVGGSVNGDNGTAGGSMPNGSGTAGANDDDSLLDDAGDAVQRGINSVTGHGRMGGASFQQMLRNARVHDTDGDLTDFENAVTPGSAF